MSESQWADQKVSELLVRALLSIAAQMQSMALQQRGKP